MLGKLSKILYFCCTLFFWISQSALWAQNAAPAFEVARALGDKPVVVVINPGHGGRDPGKLGVTPGTLHEKDLNLRIALKLGAYIEERIENVKVIYTRKTDVYHTLDDIVNIANKAKADYFISIHCNSNPNRAIYGTRTHIHSNNFYLSRKLAELVEEEFATRAGRQSRGTQDARQRGYNFQVLQYTQMPGVLVEVGFMSNPTEEKYLNSEYGQDILASAVFRAFRSMVTQNHQKQENRRTVYKVQILASTAPVSLGNQQFKQLGMRVEEHLSAQQVYKYRYLVGREYDPALAIKLAGEVKKKGFKDAFVVKLEEEIN